MCGAYLDSLFQFKALLICGNDDMWSVELTPLFFFFWQTDSEAESL